MAAYRYILTLRYQQNMYDSFQLVGEKSKTCWKCFGGSYSAINKSEDIRVSCESPDM